MSDSSTQLLVSLEARIDKFEKAMNKAGEVADKKFGEIEKRTKEAGDKMTEQLGESVEGVNKILEAIGIGFGLRELAELADAYAILKTRITLAAGSAEAGMATMEALAGVARRTASSIDGVSNSYLKNHDTLTALGYSAQTQIDMQESLADALNLSGAAGDKAANVQDQLTKAIANGRLEGKGLNAIFEDAPVLAKTFADALGVTTTQLRLLADENQLTANRIVEALAGALPKLREQAKELPLTIGQSLTLVSNAFSEFVGKSASVSGAGNLIANALAWATDNFDALSRGALAAAAVILSAYVPAMARAALASLAAFATNPFLVMAAAVGGAVFALNEFGDALHPIAGEMASLKDYGAVVWDDMKIGAEIAARSVETAFATVATVISRALGGGAVSLSHLGETAIYVADLVVNAFRLMADNVITGFTKLPQAVAEATIDAMNALISICEAAINGVIKGVDLAVEAINKIGGRVGVTLGEIGAVNLGRITNAWAGAGKAAADAYVENFRRAGEDTVGEALKDLREKAGEHAKDREKDEAQEREKSKLPNQDKPTQAPNSEFEKEVRAQQQKLAALQQETNMRRAFAGTLQEEEAAVERLKTAQELLNGAKAAGVQINDEVLSRIAKLADAYSRASAEAKALAQTQQEVADTAKQLSDTSKDSLKGFVDDLVKGKSAAVALRDAMLKMAQKLESVAWDKIWESAMGKDAEKNPFFGGIAKAITPATPVTYAPGSSLPDLKNYAKAISAGTMTVSAGVVNVNGQPAAPTQSTAETPTAPGAASPYGDLSAAQKAFGSASPAPGATSPFGDLSAAEKAFGGAAVVAAPAAIKAVETPHEAPYNPEQFPTAGFGELKFGPESELSKGLGAGLTKLGDALGLTKKAPAALSYAPSDAPAMPKSFGGNGKDFYHNAMMHESGGKNIYNDPNDPNSASGYYQFMPKTWAGVRAQNPSLGLPAHAHDASFEQQTAAYQKLTQENVAALEKAGLPVTDKNVFMGSFFGPKAPGFLKAMQANPNQSAASLLPTEAKANHNDFYFKDGTPKSAQQLYDSETKSFGNGNTTGFGPPVNQAVTQLQQSLTKGATGITSGFTQVTSTLTQGSSGIGTALGDLSKTLTGSGGGGGGFGGLGGLFGGGGGGDFTALDGFADGGFVNGKGTGTSDSNLAMVSDGEFVVNADAAGKYGNLLTAINSGKTPKLGGSQVANVANVLNGGNHVAINVTGDKSDAMLAKKIAGHVNDALAKAAPKDGMRYSPTQRSSMLASHAAKSQRSNG